MTTKLNKTVKVEDNKNVSNAVEKVISVMDECLIKLNEIKAVKLSAISSKRRPAAKEARELAKYILNNWNNLAELKNIKSEDVTNGDIQNILFCRLKNLEDASKPTEKVVKAINYKNVKEIMDSFKLTEKEIKVILLLNDQLKDNFGEVYSYIDCNDIANLLNMKVKTVKGVMGSLVKKNICETYDTETGYDVIIFSNQENMSFYDMKAEDMKAAKVNKASTKKETKKADKGEQTKEKKAKTVRKVGDVHPNHPTWLWTEYAEGKFDWRINPADKNQGKRTDKATTSTKKSEPVKKVVKKETKSVKKVKKAKKVKKELTIDEFVTMHKTAKGNKKLSEAQAKALKLIIKGYRITVDKMFFEKNDSREECNWDSVVALFNKYGIEYIPEGLNYNMSDNSTRVNVLDQDDKQMLEAAYLAGFEPSADAIPADQEINEALDFLTNKSIRL